MEKDIEKPVSQATLAKADNAAKVVPKKEIKAAGSPVSQKKSKSKVVTEVKAKARFIRIAPRKVRLVISQLPGLEVERALNYLRFVKKAAVLPVTKLLLSAIANAENNFKLDKKDLYIKKIIANDGPVLKRWQPRASGRATPIRKRTSHIELILGVKAGAKPKTTVKKEVGKEAKAEEVKIVKPQEVKKEALKIGGKSQKEEKGQRRKGFFRGIFQRKTG